MNLSRRAATSPHPVRCRVNAVPGWWMPLAVLPANPLCPDNAFSNFSSVASARLEAAHLDQVRKTLLALKEDLEKTLAKRLGPIPIFWLTEYPYPTCRQVRSVLLRCLQEVPLARFLERT